MSACLLVCLSDCSSLLFFGVVSPLLCFGASLLLCFWRSAVPVGHCSRPLRARATRPKAPGEGLCVFLQLPSFLCFSGFCASTLKIFDFGFRFRQHYWPKFRRCFLLLSCTGQVLVGPFEHHSVLLPFRESRAEVVAVAEATVSTRVHLLLADEHLFRLIFSVNFLSDCCYSHARAQGDDDTGVDLGDLEAKLTQVLPFSVPPFLFPFSFSGLLCCLFFFSSFFFGVCTQAKYPPPKKKFQKHL